MSFLLDRLLLEKTGFDFFGYDRPVLVDNWEEVETEKGDPQPEVQDVM